MAALRHHEDEQHGKRNTERAAQPDRYAKVEGGQKDADRQTDEARKLRQPRLAEEKRVETVVADLARDPGLGRPMDEGLAETTQDLEAGDRDEEWDEALTDPGDSDDGGAAITDVRRLKVSASTPVGISQRKYDVSSAVPTRTS